MSKKLLFSLMLISIFVLGSMGIGADENSNSEAVKTDFSDSGSDGPSGGGAGVVISNVGYTPKVAPQDEGSDGPSGGGAGVYINSIGYTPKVAPQDEGSDGPSGGGAGVYISNVEFK